MSAEVDFEVLATAEFSLRLKGKQRTPITIYIGYPYKDETAETETWECRFQIVPLMSRSERPGGCDSLYALKSALWGAGIMLCYYCRKYEVKLTKGDMTSIHAYFPKEFAFFYPEEAERMEQELQEQLQEEDRREQQRQARRKQKNVEPQP